METAIHSGKTQFNIKNNKGASHPRIDLLSRDHIVAINIEKRKQNTKRETKMKTVVSK